MPVLDPNPPSPYLVNEEISEVNDDAQGLIDSELEETTDDEDEDN
jgi:hypothetical protein